MDRRTLGKTPLHLKAYDNSNGPSIVPDDSLGPSQHYGPQRHAKILTSKVPECACERCKKRLRRDNEGQWYGRPGGRKGPIHLKAYDDTPHKPWICTCIDGGHGCSIEACATLCRCTLCSFERSSTLPWTDWYRPGALIRSHESAFEENQRSSMRRRDLPLHGGVNYDQCHPKELKKFIQERALEDPLPAGLTLKTAYIRILIRADRERSFRFLDLPPEMRNLIYYDLLILRPQQQFWDSRGEQFCHPQILATSQEVRKEALGVLYGENTVTCNFSMFPGYSSSYEFAANIKMPYEVEKHYFSSFGVIHRAGPSQKGSILQTCELSAHSPLLNIANVNINITIDDWVSSLDDDRWLQVCGVMQNSLLVFASTLMGKHSIKRATVAFKLLTTGDDRLHHGDREWCLANPVYSEWAALILYPLRRLRCVDHVELVGDIPPDVSNSIKADMECAQPAYNTWKEFRLVESQYDRHVDFLRKHPADLCTETLIPGDTVSQMRQRLNRAPQLVKFDLYKQLVIDEKHEAELRSNITEVRRWLENMESVTDLVSAENHENITSGNITGGNVTSENSINAKS